MNAHSVIMRCNLALALFLALSSIALAQPYPNTGNAVPVNFPGVTSLAHGAMTTSTPLAWVLGGQSGYGSSVSLAADTAGTTINVSTTVLQSNNIAGPFTKWSTTSPGGATNPVNHFQITAQHDGTDLVLAHSAFFEIQIRNDDPTATVTPTMTVLIH